MTSDYIKYSQSVEGTSATIIWWAYIELTGSGLLSWSSSSKEEALASLVDKIPREIANLEKIQQNFFNPYEAKEYENTITVLKRILHEHSLGVNSIDQIRREL